MTAWISFVSVVIVAACASAQTQEPAAIVVRPPEDFAAVAGQTVRLTCVAYGFPVPSITWTSSSQDLDLTAKISEEAVTVNDTTFLVSALQLCDITSANAAEYTCTASNAVAGNPIASNSAKTLLSVSLPITEPPSVVVHPPDMNTVDVDDTVEVVCVAYGNPIPTVTWSRPGCFDLNDTSASTNIKINSEMVTYDNMTFQTSVMQICNIQLEDSNLYTCTAKNGVPGTGLASSAASFQVRVNGGVLTPSSTPTDPAGATGASSFAQGSLGLILLVVEGVIILILLVVLSIVIVWVCKVKKTITKSQSPMTRAEEDKYTLSPGTAAEMKQKEVEEGDYADIEEISKTYPVSTNPAYKTSHFTKMQMDNEYDNVMPNEDITYEPMDSGK